MPLADSAMVLGAARPFQDVTCPELGPDVTVRVQCISAAQKDKYDVDFYYTPEGSIRPVFDAVGARARLLQFACVKEDGSPLFSVDQLPQLRDMRADVAERLFDVAQRLSGMNATIEELKSAFRQTRPAGSSTT